MSKIYKINNHLMEYNSNLINAIIPYNPESVIIGEQTWMTKNLDIDDGGEGITAINVGTHAGLDMGVQYFYTWDAAKRVVSNLGGWHLPTNLDWGILINYIGSSVVEQKIKSTQGWTYDNRTRNGTDDYGFNAMPVGYISDSSYGYGGTGGYTYYWFNQNDEAATNQYVRRTYSVFYLI